MKKLLLTSLLILGLLNLSMAKDTYKTIKYSKIKAEFKTAENVKLSKDALYHLVLFGKKAEYKMWFIIDKSDVNTAVYDLAYCDLDCDGIVGEEGEQMKCNKTTFGINFTMSNWVNPALKEKAEITLWRGKTMDEKALPKISIYIPLLGQETICDLVSKSSPQEASKVWVGYEKELYIFDDSNDGDESIFYRGNGIVKSHPHNASVHKQTFSIGYPGTNGSKWLIGLTNIPKGEYLKANIDYKTKAGKKKSYFSKLDERC